MGAEEGEEGAVEEATGFEVGIVVPKLSRAAAAAGATEDCMARLVRELEAAGLLVERVRGVPAEFIKVCVWPGVLFFLILFVATHSVSASAAAIQKSASPLVSASLGNYATRAACYFFGSNACGPAVGI